MYTRADKEVSKIRVDIAELKQALKQREEQGS